jgi:hypothetical protein
VLDAPETSCGNGRGLRTRGYVHGLCGRIRHTAEGAEEFGQKGHGKVGEEDEEEDCKELQIGVVWGVCTIRENYFGKDSFVVLCI